MLFRKALSMPTFKNSSSSSGPKGNSSESTASSSKKAVAWSTSASEPKLSAEGEKSIRKSVANAAQRVRASLRFLNGFRSRRQSQELSLDCMFDVINLSRQHGLPIDEVRMIARKLSNAKRQCDEQNHDEVDFPFLLTAYRHFKLNDQFGLNQFLEWYKQHMFSDVAPRSACMELQASHMLMLELAKQYGVDILKIDKIKSLFDRIDIDKSGLIDFSEFEALMMQMMKADADSFSRDRLKNFWKELDAKGNGAVDFPDFCSWHLKYFNAGDNTEGGHWSSSMRHFCCHHFSTVITTLVPFR